MVNYVRHDIVALSEMKSEEWSVEEARMVGKEPSEVSSTGSVRVLALGNRLATVGDWDAWVNCEACEREDSGAEGAEVHTCRDEGSGAVVEVTPEGSFGDGCDERLDEQQPVRETLEGEADPCAGAWHGGCCCGAESGCGEGEECEYGHDEETRLETAAEESGCW